MAKRIDPAKAKAAKQKKMAIVLCVLLAAVMAIQGPKTLKMLKGGAPAPVAAETTPTPIPTSTTAGAPVAPATAAGGVPTPTTVTPAGTAAQAAVLADSDPTVSAGEGQLLSFEQFGTKDPFQQQAVAKAPETGSPAPASTPKFDTPSTGATDPGAAENPPIATGAGSGSGSTPGGVTGAPVPTTPTASPQAPAAPAAATTISVNGEVSSVVPEAPFPTAEPTFVLVSTSTDGLSAEIGIAGGDLSDGKATIRLTLGKKLTLQNTADGSRYELVLLSVQGFVTPVAKGK